MQKNTLFWLRNITNCTLKRGYMKTIYISGKITGTDDYVSRFSLAEQNLKERGFKVLNPVREGKRLERYLAPEVPTWGQYMKQAIKAMMSADYIFMMKEYKESKGARLELLIAKVLKFNIIYEQ